jgi:tetratricopeptide (TPR) repeat protein
MEGHRSVTPRSSTSDHKSAILENCAAAFICGSCTWSLVHFWRYYFGGEPPEWLTGPLPPLLAGIAFGVIWHFMGWIRRTASVLGRRTLVPSGDRIAIYVADLFGDDQEGTARANVVASIQHAIGTGAVEVLTTRLRLRLADGSVGRAVEDTNAEARRWLRRNDGELLIWGRILTLNQMSVLELRFVTADGPDDMAGQRFRFDRELLLEEKFAPEMGAALGAVAGALALPATERGTAVGYRLSLLADRLRLMTEASTEKLRADDRAVLLESYGKILGTLGDQLGDTTKLESAVAAFRAALVCRDRNLVPDRWAATQNNLGAALALLGDRETSNKHLEEALAAFRAAQEQRSVSSTPVVWAMTQSNIGNVLMNIGVRERGTVRLEEAVAAYCAALEETQRDLVTLDWAGIQNNLGGALMRLGEREGGTERLEEAIRAYRAALEEARRDRVPLGWAGTLSNLASALLLLSDRKIEVTLIREAVAAFRDALEERSRDRVPLHWAASQHNLGYALTKLG